MKYYILKILEGLHKTDNGTAVTPTAKHLFKIEPNAEKLNNDESVLFHHVVAQLLFLCKRRKLDMQTAVLFLTTRVKYPDFDDIEKLKQAIKYLWESRELVFTLESNSSGTIHWWVDTAFGVHHNYRSHTGGMLSLGKGSLYASSRK